MTIFHFFVGFVPAPIFVSSHFDKHTLVECKQLYRRGLMHACHCRAVTYAEGCIQGGCGGFKLPIEHIFIGTIIAEACAVVCCSVIKGLCVCYMPIQ